MRESFNEYKKVLEKNLVSIDYLFSGDVNGSSDMSYSEIKKNPLVSPSLIINCINKIYKESFDILKSRSKEIIIPQESDSNIDINFLISKIDTVLTSYPRYLFTSKEAYKYLGYDKFHLDNTRPLPGYFYDLTKITGATSRIYYSPEIEEDKDVYTIYAADHPFQSLVYGLQNMEYTTECDLNDSIPINERDWKHTIKYKLYDCKFSAVKIVIKQISKIREEKLNQIFSK